MKLSSGMAAGSLLQFGMYLTILLVAFLIWNEYQKSKNQ